MPLLSVALAFAVAAAGGWAYLHWAPRQALDVPNERSSHIRPTLRGGGLVIVLGFFAGLAVWLANGGILSPRALGWLAGAVLVASVSFVDDLHPLPATPRLITHLAGAVLLTFAGVQLAEPTAIAALLVAFVYIIVLTNVYNFMDGIDGLAAAQAIVAGAALSIAGVLVRNPLVAISGGLLSASSLGFAIYNLPPARMFMGDVGSTFLGFSFAGLGLLANIGVGGDRLPIEFGLVLFAPFLFDGLVTLSRRVVRGERWYAAHRSHYYQRLVQCGLTHAQVTCLYTGLGVVAAGAALAGLYASEALRVTLALVAYVPMLAVVALVWRLEQPNHRSNVVPSDIGSQKSEVRSQKSEVR
ncbi:MAG TPA: glycosyltransferase family 4 protein [Chloroflexota bacterium]|jgi:UDP-N-acetylmuramyl pentapeptide phosphotransferase/UDP-N-acetylglucosamine-1-phosphate transferase